jgi:seryl-tRNA synthetase
MAEVAELKTAIPDMEAAEKKVSDELDKDLAGLPNLPADDVPDGTDETANVERHRFGAKRDYASTPKQHFDLGEALGQMDFETAAKLSGARFVVLKKGLAHMERALGQFMLDVHTGEHGYTEIAPPLLVRDDVMFGTAQLPKFEDDQFWAIPGSAFAAANRDSRYGLIPTAEVSLTNAVRERILGEAEVRQTFRVPRLGVIAGCYMTRGTIRRNSQVRLIRDGVVVYEGRVGSLRRFKDDVAEVREGFECGIGLENFQDVKEGDVIEAFEVEEVARQISS